MPAQDNNDNNTSAFVNEFLAGWDDDDPFRSPSPETAGTNRTNNKKRKEPDTLGIDKEIDVTKKARVPRVKLDDARLLSDKGIPKLRKTASKLKLKGKGHEVSQSHLCCGQLANITRLSFQMPLVCSPSTRNGSTTSSRKLLS